MLVASAWEDTTIKYGSHAKEALYHHKWWHPEAGGGSERQHTEAIC